MPIKKKITGAVRKIKISRFRTYKKLGFLGHRRTVDKLAKTAFLLLLALAVLSLFYIHPDEKINVVSDTIEQPNIVDVPAVSEDIPHEELGDAPVEPDNPQSALSTLEKGVADGTVDMNTYSLEKGEALVNLLKRAGLEANIRQHIIDGLEILIDLRSLQPGMTFMIFTGPDKEFLGISLTLKNGETTAVIKEDEETYTPFSQEGRIETKNIRITGAIERTFAGSAEKAGVPKALIAQITNALDGEVDFAAIQEGDTFDIIYEQKTTAGGLELGDKEILYIGLNIGKKQIHRYAWNSGGTSTFFNPRGQSAEKELLKKPIKGRPRTSSPYGWRRHPVLMARIFHSGVDLAIALGTPIMAAGDGTITQLGRKGAYGKYIRIKHSNGYQTAYGHMNGYKTGLKVGSKVKRGDVIGYIGQTGRATGPHLHFEVWKNGKTVNPLGTYVLIAKQLTGDQLTKFQEYATTIHPDFNKHIVGTLAPIPPRKPTQINPQPSAETSSNNN